MEEIPNLNLNQLPEEPEKEVDSKRDSFAESWRTFRSRFTDFSLENIRNSDISELQSAKQERDKDDDDDDIISDDDDEDDKNIVVKKSTNKRRIFKEKIGTTPNIKKVIAEESNDKPNEQTTEYQEQYDIESKNNEIEIDIDNSEQLNVQPQSTSEELSYTELSSIPVREDAFSIKEVINKKRLNIPSSDSVEPQYNSSQQNNNVNNYYTQEEVYHRQRNGGLIALDILNYGLALRRDNKNKRLTDKKIQKLSDEVKKKFGIINRPQKPAFEENGLLKINHQPQIRESIKYQKIDIQNTNNIQSNVGYQKIIETKTEVIDSYPEINNPIDPKTETVIYQKNVLVNKENEPNYQSIESRFENIDRQYIKKDNKKNKYTEIPISTVSPDNPKDLNIKSKMNNIVSPPNSSLISENKDYKNIIMPGLWGAITGIIVFIILYMLTIR